MIEQSWCFGAQTSPVSHRYTITDQNLMSILDIWYQTSLARKFQAEIHKRRARFFLVGRGVEPRGEVGIWYDMVPLLGTDIAPFKGTFGDDDFPKFAFGGICEIVPWRVVIT